MGRRRPGIRYGQAQANVATVADEVLRESLPRDWERIDYLREGRLVLSPGRVGNSPLGEVYGRSLWTLQALVGLLLVIGCANLANLQVSRSLHRQHEFVVRSALGAKRIRLARQLVIESVMVAVAGSIAGLALSQWMSALLVRYLDQSDFPVFARFASERECFWMDGRTYGAGSRPGWSIAGDSDFASGCGGDAEIWNATAGGRSQKRVGGAIVADASGAFRFARVDGVAVCG
jgi:hypothetical protein